jgi:outer membrane protein assembly factor BamB
MSQRILLFASERAGALAGAAAASSALAALAWWFSVDPTPRLVERRPGMDGRAATAQTTELVAIGEGFEQSAGVASVLPGDWPGFRGPRRDNVVPDATGIAESWGPAGPAVLWSVDLGEGHSGPAVAEGRVYLLDYDEKRRSDALRCLSLADGREIWRRFYRVRIKRNHGFSRTVPAVAGGLVVSIGPRGHVMAVDARTGDLRFTIDLEKEYGTSIPLWYTGQCPLIDNGVLVLAPAGRALLVGMDVADGRVLWSVPNPRGWQMSHTSVMPMRLGDRKMYVYSAIGGTVGVAADGPERGRVLWETTLWTQSVLAPSPLALPEGRIFLTAGYGAGSMLLQVVPEGDGYAVRELGRLDPTRGLTSEQQTPLVFRGHLFGIEPKDAGALRNQLVCYRAEDLSRPIWSSGPTHRFGLGPYLIAGDKLLVLNDDGVLTMLQVSTTSYRQLAQAKVMDGVDAWAPMALAGGRLLLRDSHRLLCLDLTAAGGRG